ncbi:MAG: ROK family transcriptional regulator [Lachnospiraceae bacterium]|nr:ROK family transcriptional regulator [Lachnospiraceae bacterium]
MKPEQGEERREIRRANQARIARLIMEAGSISKGEIAARLGFSMPTTLQHIRELTEAGYVMESGEYGSTGGRKAKMLSIVGDMGFGAGMEITENYISYVLVNLKKQLIRKARIRLPFSRDFSYYESIGNWLQVFLEQTGVEQKKILGVGIALPGMVDPKEKLLIHSHVLHAEHVSFKRFESMVGYPCIVDSDAGGAAYMELSGENRDGVYLSLNDMVGGAVWMNHALYSGDDFRGAQFGHMRIEKNGRSCYCGSKGCLDAYCSTRALTGEDRSLEGFFGMVKKREPEYIRRWDEYLDSLAMGVVNLRCMFGCDVVLGGEVGAYLNDFRKDLDRKVMEYDRLDPDTSFLRIGKCLPESSACGVAVRFTDRFFDRL